MSARILVVDDEPSVTDLLAYNLRKAHPDLILLDLMLPEIDGLDVCRELRKSTAVPIIMITALGEETDRVVGPEVGADDYVTKRFSMRELLARVKAVLRRARPEDGEPAPPAVLHGPDGLMLDVERRLVTIGPQPIELTRLEFDLLHCLLVNVGEGGPVSLGQISIRAEVGVVCGLE